MINQVLLVDDDANVREALGQTIELADLKPRLAANYIIAKDHITPEFAGVVVSDIRMPGKDGFALLDYAQSVDAELPVILLTGEADIPMAVRAVSAGAFGFLEKPCAPRDLLAVVNKALKQRELVLENRKLKRALKSGDAAARMLVGVSPQSENMREQARAFARSSAHVLISGEPGSGTSKLAEVVHLLSAGPSAPFVKIPAATQDAASLGAAIAGAAGGTLFLDEIANLRPGAQFAALEHMDHGSGTRLIAGSYQDLRAMVAAGQFNHDLFLRLDAARIIVPPLRERPGDIAVLFRHYVALACEQAALPEPEITSDVIARLMAQDWPGNARGLMNAAMRFSMGLGDSDQDAETLGLSEQLAQVERSLLVTALQRQNGNATEAARALKLPRKTFYDKLARHGIKADSYRGSDG